MNFISIALGFIFTLNLELTVCMKNNAYLLQDHKNNALVISITNQNGFKSSSNNSQLFTVQAPKYHRVMIVIQQLHLWSEPDPDFQSYLQFMDSDGSASEIVYGNIDPDETDKIPQYLTGPRSFVSTDDTASLAFINLRPDYIISSKNERRVYAKLAFTAFRDTCSYRSIPPLNSSDLESVTKLKNEVVYRSCITSSASGKNCIAAELFCDSIINCGETESGTFGLDETYINCDAKTSASRTFSTTSQPEDDGQESPKKHDKKSGDLLKTFILDQDYDEYYTELFKSVIIGFLGLCTTCILIAFVVTMFCLKNNGNR
ncbi:hypothetical protein Ocin01_06917 [Orchesella cincta]|uniref:Uncharacterized protein n=1 Tax=Orchesella cincta TaxID=48709 RepID=A0A1D2N3B9_ORCCI|nr:hypothetical protein Ocin01_06917 [Orchesella cincta]